MDRNIKGGEVPGDDVVHVDPKTKGQHPDPDMTDPHTLPTTLEQARISIGEKGFGSATSINRDHAEPTQVTDTSNDNYVESKYIDVGGGD